jgi:uncharacterized SAM-binding protein YcdF (DUF218 family)
MNFTFDTPGAEPEIADDLNLLASFLAANDFPDLQLTPATVDFVLGTPVADVLVLLGNSVLHTSDAAFAAMKRGVAKRLLIVGGRGHSTGLLYESLAGHPRYRDIEPQGRSEAELLAEIATQFHHIDSSLILLETESTNCGENAASSLRTLIAAAVSATTLILVQDPTMQRRSAASFRKVWVEATLDLKLANFPSFIPRVEANRKDLSFAESQPSGLWTMQRFISLVLGEIPRLRDDTHGYGPNGRGFIGHVDIPASVLSAHARLAGRFPRLPRR